MSGRLQEQAEGDPVGDVSYHSHQWGLRAVVEPDEARWLKGRG
jgi:hypothetical protein